MQKCHALSQAVEKRNGQDGGGGGGGGGSRAEVGLHGGQCSIQMDLGRLQSVSRGRGEGHKRGMTIRDKGGGTDERRAGHIKISSSLALPTNGIRQTSGNRPGLL